MEMQNNHLVIMAGGVGSRFWPMSTPDYPKQFIDVLGCGRTLIQLTVDRFKGLCPSENIWVVTSERYADEVKRQLPFIKNDHILLEPCRRNTAPCIAYVSWKIMSIDPNANIVVTPSDHIVIDVNEFQRVVQSSLLFTQHSNTIVTLGMTPNRPETGYGYIQADLSNHFGEGNRIYKVESFKEKPNLATAEEYIKNETFYWNAGIFVWNVKTVINAIRVYQPDIANIFENLLPFYFTDKEQDLINAQFPLCENISIDYAIMEKADNVYVYPASFGWSDLGTWGSLHSNMEKDSHNNVLIGENIKIVNSRNCIIHTSEERKVVIQGLDGYIVAEKDNMLLICQLTEEQRIKEF